MIAQNGPTFEDIDASGATGTICRVYVMITHVECSNVGTTTTGRYGGCLADWDRPDDPGYWLLPRPVRNLAPVLERRPHPPAVRPRPAPAQSWHRFLQRRRENRGS